MKRFLQISTVLTIILSAGVILSSVSLQYFQARTTSEGILVEWKTGEEGGTTKFQVERSAATPDNFIFITNVNATGSNSYYSYVDESVDYQTTPLYYYRLKIMDANGNYTYSNSISVVHSVSGIRSTWGSIKAIFR